MNIEQYIIGCMLFDEQSLVRVVSELNAGHFKTYKKEFNIIKQVYEKEKCVDYGLLNDYGLSTQAIAQLVNSISTTAYIDKYIQRSKEKKYIQECYEYANNILLTKKYDELMSEMTKQPILNTSKEVVTTKEGLRQSLLRLKERKEHNKLKGVNMGFNRLYRLVGGWKDGEVILIEGKTNAGKSILAQNMAVKMAKDDFVVWFGLEMPKSQLMDRTAMMHLNILTTENFNDPNTIQSWQDTKLREYKDNGAIDNLVIVGMDELKYKTLAEIKAIVFNEINRRNQKPKTIFIDYLRLIRGGNGQKSYERMQDNFSKIMDYASELMVPIVLIVSQNKQGQTAGSSDMLYDAHQHYVLTRDGQDADLDIIKNRDGGKGSINLVWNENHLRFEVSDFV